MLTFAMTTLLVPEYEEGIAFYVRALGFDLVEDTNLGGGKRWVVVGAPGGGKLLLARATDDGQRAAIGNQTGGRVGFFLHTDDFAATHARMLEHGIQFAEEPRTEPYGTVAVFTDPFGNGWDLIEPR